MPRSGFGCSNFTSIFRSSLSGSTDPVVLDVANAIFYGGRVEGIRGLESVAHVIQNRCGSAGFPNDAHDVVIAGAEQFQVLDEASFEPSARAERRLQSHARQLAAKLVYPPKRLSFPDPTSGALYFHERGQVLFFTRQRPPACTDDAERVASENSFMESLDVVPDDDASGIQPPRLAQATISSCPLRNSAALAATEGTSENSSLHESSSGHSHVPSSISPVAGRVPSRSSGFSSSPSIPSTMPMAIGAYPSSSSAHRPAISSTVSSSSNAPRAPSRPSPGRAATISSVRVFSNVHRGPMSEDGFHDMMLPCGLFQDEIIDLMFRDLSPEDFETLTKLDERVPKKNLIQRNSVDKLPRLLAKDCGCSQCGVCLAEVPATARMAQLPCRHAFHPACISRWLTQCKSTCPLCFAPIDKATAAAPSNVSTVCSV